MPASAPLPPPPPAVLTPFARKYGITPTRAQYNAVLNPAYPGLQKSFFTPVRHVGADEAERDRAGKTRRLQRSRLKGLTTLALIENDFISERGMRMATLTNPIHPLLARTRWKTSVLDQVEYPLVDGNGVTRGTWNLYENDLAWEVMLPALRLASMILSHLHTHPWLDTLLLGREEPLDPARFPAPSLNLRSRKHQTTAQDHKVLKIRAPGPNNASECATAFTDIQKWPALRDIQYGMVVTDRNAEGDKHRNDTTVNGFTTWLSSDYGEWCGVYIAYERVALLLRNDLSEADQLCLHVLTANTLVHEMMHAIGLAKRHREQLQAGGEDEYPRMHEPFIEDEVVAELGASMEDAVWGGILHGICDSVEPDMVPLGYGLLRGPEPILSTFPALLSPPLPKVHLFRPIQVAYYETVQQEDFWDFQVRNFSHFRPGTILRDGSPRNLVSTMSRDPPSYWKVVETIPEYLSAVALPNRKTFIIQKLLQMTPAEILAYADASKEKETHKQHASLMVLRMRQAEGIWNQVEMLLRGDLQRQGFTVEQGLGSLLGAIEEILGTVTNLLVVIKRFDLSSAERTRSEEDIRSFNRGLRQLLGEIATGSDNPVLAHKADTLSQIVESIRVLLTVSPSLPNGISLQDDLIRAQRDEADCVQRIEEARLLLEAGDISNANKICEQVTRSMSSTLLTKCAARILMCHNDKADHAVRLNVVSRTIETLQKTPPPEGRGAEQARVLDLAQQLQTRLAGNQARPNSNNVFLV